jgi:predicted TIM-barrel enzyme
MTDGGLVGSKALSLNKAAEFAQKIIDVTKSINMEIICLAHGGPFSTPEDTAYMYQNTDALGYVGASSIERIPIEKAVIDTVSQFKSTPLKKNS